MNDVVGWRVIWYGPLHHTHLIYAVDTLREAYNSAYIGINPKDLQKPLVYYGTKRLG